LNELHGLIGKREETYSHVMIRVGLSFAKNITKICCGRFDFLQKGTPTSDDVDLNYGNLRLLRAYLSVKEASDLASELIERKELRVKDITIPVSGQYHTMGLPYVGSMQHYAGIRLEWPFSLYGFRLDPNATGYPPQGRMVKLNLPIYPRGDDAVADFCDLDIGTGTVQNEIFFVLPDFRARIREMKILQEKLRVGVEPGEESAENLRLKFYLETGQESVSSTDIAIKNGFAEFPYEGDIKLTIAHLLSARTGDDIDHREFSPWWDRSRNGIVVEASELRIQELIREGEGLRIELKEELPSDEHRLLDSVVEFSNTAGGTILVGVAENGEVVGIRRSVEDLRETISNWISEKCDPRPEVEMNEVCLDEKTVLVLDVRGGPNKPYQDTDRGFFVRRGASNRQARRSEIEEMFRPR